jgi:hypothetical protein
MARGDRLVTISWSIHRDQSTDRVRIFDLAPHRADNNASLARRAWTQRVMASAAAIDQAGVTTLRVAP